MRTLKIRFREEDLITLPIHNHIEDKIPDEGKIEGILESRYGMTPEILEHYTITKLGGEIVVHPSLDELNLQLKLFEDDPPKPNTITWTRV